MEGLYIIFRMYCCSYLQFNPTSLGTAARFGRMAASLCSKIRAVASAWGVRGRQKCRPHRITAGGSLPRIRFGADMLFLYVAA